MRNIASTLDEMSLSVSLRYLVNLSDSFFKNVPRLKIYKMLCLLLTLIISIILKHVIQSITPTFNHNSLQNSFHRQF